MSFPPRALGSLALVLAAAAAQAQETPQPAPRPPARLYTNADLERVHPFASETGVSSVPAVPAGEVPGAEREPEARGRGEAFWRREAAAVRERLRALEERAAGLRARIAERERSQQNPVYGARRRSASGSSVASLRASLAAVERRIQRTQDDLEERARRDGALPGWLR